MHEIVEETENIVVDQTLTFYPAFPTPRSVEYCPEYMHFHSVLSKRNYVVLSDGHAILLHFFSIQQNRGFTWMIFCIISGYDRT